MSEQDKAGAGRPITIACNLYPEHLEYLRAHSSRPTVLPYSQTANAWDVPKHADVLMTFFLGWENAPKTKPEGWPHNLKWIQISSAGIDLFPDWVFDVPLVTTGRGISAEPIAEYIVAAIFAHEKQLFDDLIVRSADKWVKRTLKLVSGKSAGFYGFGAIARRASEKLLALGMDVHAVRRNKVHDLAGGIHWHDSLLEMVPNVDHLILAVPLTDETRRSVNKSIFSQTKPGMHLVNICRGEVLDDEALLAALNEGQISAATLDVTAPEPLPAGHIFYEHPRVRLTPHISWSSENSASSTAARLIENLDRFLAGKQLIDIVVRGRGY